MDDRDDHDGREARPWGVLDGLTDEVRVVAVVAPAGSGKTHLARTWLAARGHEHTWLTCQDGSSVAELASVVSGTTPGLVVLDDVHRLANDRQALRHIERAVEAGWRFLALGRSEPPTGFWRLVGRGHAAVIGFADLLWAPAEVARAARAHGLDVADDWLAELHRLTAGWPALVDLVLREALRAPSPGAVPPTSDARHYVQAEVIAPVDTDLRSFAARLARLGPFSSDLARDALQLADDDPIDALRRNQVMLLRADDGAEVFDFPPIAREALLRDSAAPDREEAVEIDRRAAQWHEARGDWDRALPHMLDVGPEEAVRQLSRMIAAVEPQGRSEDALRWFRQLPARWRMQPAPITGLVLALVQAGLAPEARQLLDQTDTSTWDRPDQLAEIAMAEAMVERMMFRHPTAVAAAQRSLELIDGIEITRVSPGRLSYLRVMAVEQLREIRLWEGDLGAVRDLMEQVRHDVVRSELQLSLVHSTAITALAALDAGRLADAGEKARSALRLAERRGFHDTHVVAEAHLVLAALAAERDETAAAVDQLERVRALADRGIFPTTVRRAELLVAPALATLGRTAEAVAVLEGLAAEGRRTGDPILRERLLAATARVHAESGDEKAARAALGQLAGLRPTVATARDRAVLTCRLGAASDLRAFPELLDASGEPADAVVARMLRARLAGDRADGVLEMVDGLRLAEELDLWRTVLDAVHGLGGLLSGAQAHTDLVLGPGPAYVRRVATAVVASSRKQSVLSEREAEIAQFLPSRKSVAQIAADLYISENTVKTHIRHIYQKLGVEDRDQAVEQLTAMGLLVATP